MGRGEIVPEAYPIGLRQKGTNPPDSRSSLLPGGPKRGGNLSFHLAPGKSKEQSDITSDAWALPINRHGRLRRWVLIHRPAEAYAGLIADREYIPSALKKERSKRRGDV